MTFRRVTQLELEFFADAHAIGADGDSGQGTKALTAQEMRERSMAARQLLQNRIEDPNEAADWYSGYHRLINAGWPWRIAAWVAWSSVPKSLRFPATQEALATEVLGLTSDRIIANWRKKYPALDQLIADLQADDMIDARADVMNALKQSASAPDYKHAPDRRLYFVMTGDLVEHSKIDVNNKNAHKTVKDLSDAELDALIGDPKRVRDLLNDLRNEASEEDGNEPSNPEA